MQNALAGILARPKTVFVLMLMAVIAGTLSYIAIPKEANPDIDVPIYVVNVSQRGISPSDADRLLIRPMETELRGIDGLKEITATAREGGANLVLEFDIDADPDVVLADLRDKVDQAKADLPADADEPGVFETNFALEPTIIVTLSGDVPERTLVRLANGLADEIEAISSVREVDVQGDRDEVLEVILDLERLESYNITQRELLDAITRNNALVAAGTLDTGSGRFSVKVPGLIESALDVYGIPIKQGGEAVVTLGDVAELRRTFTDPTTFTRVNGQPAISLEVVKRIGTNIIENNAQVRAVTEAYTADWPETVRVGYLLDQSSFIFEVLGSLQSSIMTAIVLVLISVVAVLGIRSGLLVGLAVPGSFMIAFLILSALGQTVNMMVMFGMVLTVGMLVDGAIVVSEYADRKIEEGVRPSVAYTRAAQLMFWPVVSSTLTTLAAFLPLLLWPGVPGQFMSYLPRMVIIVLSASLVTALIFLPVTGTIFARIARMVGRFSRAILTVLGFVAVLFVGLVISNTLTLQAVATAEGGTGILPTLASGAAGRALAVALLALVAAYAVNRLATWGARRREAKRGEPDPTALMLSSRAPLIPRKLTGVTGAYVRFLNLFTSNILGNLVGVAVVAALVGGTFWFFMQRAQGVEFFIEEEPDVAIVLVQARGNLAATEVRDLVGEVEREVLSIPGIDNVVMTATASAGGGGGSFGGPQDLPADQIGQLQLELAEYGDRRKAEAIFADIRAAVADIPGIKVEIRKIEGGPPTGKDVQVRVKSPSYDRVVETIGTVRQYIDGVDGLIEIEDGRPLPGIEWELSVDREAAGRYGASIQEIGSMIQLVTNGVLVDVYRPDDSEDEVEIRVRLPEGQRSFDTLDELRLPTQRGLVPLSNFVTRAAEPKVTSIVRRDGLYSMDVKANLAPDYVIADPSSGRERPATPNDLVTEVKDWIAATTFPDGVQVTTVGADEEQAESMAFLGRAAVGSLFLMFIILLTQYNSFYQTILTLLTVVLAIGGVLLGMAVTGQKFSVIMTGTGVVALAGIVVNNAIVLTDTFNRLREEGVKDVRQAVLKTAAQRLRPILLTTVTTILGLIPMALQINLNFFERTIAVGGITSMWWVQMSTAIISGLAFSTVLTLFLIPILLALPSNAIRAGVGTGRGVAWIGRQFARPLGLARTFEPRPVPVAAAPGRDVHVEAAPLRRVRPGVGAPSRVPVAPMLEPTPEPDLEPAPEFPPLAAPTPIEPAARETTPVPVPPGETVVPLRETAPTIVPSPPAAPVDDGPDEPPRPFREAAE